MSGDAGSNGWKRATEHYRAGRRKEAEQLCRGCGEENRGIYRRWK